MSPLTKRFKGWGITEGISAFLFTVFIYLGLGSGIYFIFRRLAGQALDFAFKILEDPEEFIKPLSEFVSKIIEKHPNAFENIDFDSIRRTLIGKLGEYAGRVIERGAKFAIGVPDMLLFLFAMIFSTYYFIKRSGEKGNKYKKIIPKSVLAISFYCKNLFVKYIKNYLLSMLIMLIIVFFILILGFWLLDVKYFILLGFLISLIDMLPILGVGTVLAPWGIYCLFSGNTIKGIGLLALYIIILTVRQFIEPRLIGKKVGLSPLITLIAVYVGLKAFGIPGVIFAPFVAYVGSSLLHEMSAELNGESGEG